MASWPPAWLTPASQSEIDAGDGAFASVFAEMFGSIGKDGVAGRAGQPLQLRDWQKSLLEHLYARDASGGYRFQTALIGMPRKNGKSALTSAAIALYKTFAEGVQGGEVIVAAAEKEQARIVFGEARRMVESSELSELATIYKDSIFVPSTNSVMKVVSAEAYSKEGANPHAVILDELHAHQSRDLFDVFSLAMGNRGKIAQLIAITTAGVKTDITGQDSIAYQLYQYGQRVARNEINDPNFFMAWWEAIAEADHKDSEAWRMANPGFDDLVAEADFVSAVRRTPEAEFRTKRLNQWVNTQTSWLPTGSWEKLADQRELSLEDEYIVGFDGSFSGDTTVLVGCTIPKEKEKPYLFLIKAWEKPPGADDSWRVEIQEAEDTIAEFCARYQVREVVCDPYRWQRSMEVLADKGIPIVEYPTTSARRMVSACAKFYDAVTEERLATDGDPLITRHLYNAVTKSDNLGIRIVKENRASSRRIDAAVAAVAAYDRASGKLEEVVVPQFYF